MANMTVSGDAKRFYYKSRSEWSLSWQSPASGYVRDNSYIWAVRVPVNNVLISKLTLSIRFETWSDEWYAQGPRITVNLYQDDPSAEGGATPVATVTKPPDDRYQPPDESDGTELEPTSFVFDNLSLYATDYFYYTIDYDRYASKVSSATVDYALPGTCAVTYTNIPALTPSIVLPSGTQNGAQGITFSWQTSGAGTQKKAELQWSTDGVNWQDLTTVGADQTYTAPAAKFPTGTVYWHIRVTSSYDIESAWVQRSFTVQYPAASVTLTTPTSGSQDGAQAIIFAWEITPGGGSINGTQMEVSSDDGLSWTQIINSDVRAVTRYSAAAGSLPAGRLIWRVRARDSYAGWSAYRQASVTITYSAVSQVVPVNTPTSGIYNAASDRSFTVALQASGIVHTPFTVASATLHWRHGESGDFTAVTMTPNGNQASVTISGGTFPSGVLQWYAEATDNTGRTTQTETYTLTALNAAVEATPLSPINTLESGSGPITFYWTYGSIDGAPQSRAEIQYSTDGGSTWTTLPEISGNETRAEIPAGTFPGGTVTWQVRAYNNAGTAGPWSSAVSFISFSAPIVTGVSGDGKPFLTISWQVDAQQAYEVEAAGETYGPYYGETVRSFTLPDPLPDGSYTVRVRAQNRYGLWSEWAEGDISVLNVPGAAVTIAANDGESVRINMVNARLAPIITEQPQDLQTTDTSAPAIFRCGILPNPAQVFKWRSEMLVRGYTNWAVYTPETAVSPTATDIDIDISENDIPRRNGYQFRFFIWPDGDESMGLFSRAATFTYAEPSKRSPLITGFFPAEYGYFLIYRDGELIGKTYGASFVDRAALGTHEYYVIQVLGDGYYTRSNTVTGTATVRCPMITALDDGELIPLKLSENSRRAMSFTHKRQVAYTQYAGATFPAAEIGENETLTASFDVAYLQTDQAAADAFEELLGREVILKSPGGQVVVGVLEGYDINSLRFYKAYRCTLQQMDWGDFADETGNI